MRNRPDNHLYYGDNLEVLRKEIADESVDLIYLDPPFNSHASYNVLFKSPDGVGADAQIEAFEDSWHWNDKAEEAFDQVARSGYTSAFELLRAMRGFLGDNDLMAYLAMMAVRLVELHRVLKPSGSLFLHCDPTASHYLKLLLDGVFGARSFRNEIVWDYSFRLMDLPHFFNRKHDIILFYAKTASAFFSMPKTAWTRADLLASRKQAVHVEADGSEWIWMPGGKGNSKNKLRRIDEILAGGKAMSDVWSIPIISSSSKERLGYPTQKPTALLERIVAAASRPDDVVLDPFCGCGTAVHAAQKLGRQWVGIDVTHLAITLIEKRMRDAFPDAVFTVEGTPKDLASAEDLARRDKYQFQWWAVSMVDALPHGGKKKGPDGGIDGLIYFNDLDPAAGKMVTQRAIVSVKGGLKPGVAMVETLAATIERERAPIGVLLMLAKPPPEMKRRAAAVGVYRNGIDDDFPRLQIITIAELFAGKRPRIPNIDRAMFKRAAREQKAPQHRLL